MAPGVRLSVRQAFVGAAFRLDRRGWKAAPTANMQTGFEGARTHLVFDRARRSRTPILDVKVCQGDLTSQTLPGRLLKNGVSVRDPALRGLRQCSHTMAYAALAEIRAPWLTTRYWFFNSPLEQLSE